MIASRKAITAARAAVLLVGVVVLSRSALAQTTYAPPPRTVEDILAVLDQYKPNPDAAQKAHEALERQPPAGASGNELAQFYRERATAALNMGLMGRQIADFRLALQYVNKGSEYEATVLRELAGAELYGGNMVEALRLTQQFVAAVSAYRGRQLVGYALVARRSAELGDIAYPTPLMRSARSRRR